MEILETGMGAEIPHDILIYKQKPPFGVKICSLRACEFSVR